MTDALAECKSLTELNVFNNRLIKLPQELRSLVRLQDLNASGNKLKTFPQPGDWTNLRRLAVSWNTIVHVPDLEGLNSLVHLQLNDNILTEWPCSVTTLVQLEMLDCSMNQIEAIPGEIGRLTSLTTLNMRCNKLREIPDTVSRLRRLSILNVGENRLSVLPPSLGRLAELKVLMANDNRLEVLPPTLTTLVMLEHGSFADNPALIDDSNAKYDTNFSVMSTLRVICSDHGGKLQFPKVKISMHRSSEGDSDD